MDVFLNLAMYQEISDWAEASLLYYIGLHDYLDWSILSCSLTSSLI